MIILESKENTYEINFNIKVYLKDTIKEDILVNSDDEEFQKFIARIDQRFSDKGYKLSESWDNEDDEHPSYYYLYIKVENEKVIRASLELRVSDHQFSAQNYINTKNDAKRRTKRIARDDYDQTKGFESDLININGHKYNSYEEAFSYFKKELDDFERTNLNDISSYYSYDGTVISSSIRKNIERIRIKEGTKKIKKDAFNGCISLERIKIPNSVNFIGSNAFKECMIIPSIIIPDSVKYIESEAFNKCFSLETLTIQSKSVTLDDDIIVKCPELTVKCYKDSTVEEYCKENNIKYELI